jgi:hypothetical protein
MSSPRRRGVPDAAAACRSAERRDALPRVPALAHGGTASALLQQYDQQQQEKGEAALNLWLYCCIHIYIIGCGCTVAVNYLNPVPQTVVCDLRSVVMKIGGYTI